MTWNKTSVLRNLAEAGGITNEYPFIQMGLDDILGELLHDQLVVRVPSNDNFCEIHITAKGRLFLIDEEVTTEQKRI